ncbi:VOC family protein [Nocardioides sp. CER19]|uniref:VOC family protein n=1 Tax=Nocardioides sp. CER19 TaxID=3038538 RepID=UPI002448FEC9|nr:VOC family protein [Nocardioides sp. CER19]MDH2414965.1 VOC family protein [Nocardioides sp. CER19]
MTVSITDITFDAGDARALATFWANLLGWQVFYDDDPVVLVAPHYPTLGKTTMLFIPVPEGKTAKNRVHLDLTPTDMTRDEQVEQAIALGATVVGDHREEEDGGGWVTLADPEGNEFCIVRSDAERPAPTTKAWRLG